MPGCSTPATPPIPAIAKFYGDMQEHITGRSLHLLFFTLDLNRLDDVGARQGDGRSPRSAITGPWIEDIARTSRSSSKTASSNCSTKVGDRLTSAFNRLFDETMVALRFKVGGKSLPLEQTLNIMQDADPKKRKAAA
jgi:oligoendopeptidase F